VVPSKARRAPQKHSKMHGVSEGYIRLALRVESDSLSEALICDKVLTYPKQTLLLHRQQTETAAHIHELLRSPLGLAEVNEYRAYIIGPAGHVVPRAEGWVLRISGFSFFCNSGDRGRPSGRRGSANFRDRRDPIGYGF
jgi:hypothetical protein